jgi:3-hydroxyacyl-CoA dehydrogenase
VLCNLLPHLTGEPAVPPLIQQKLRCNQLGAKSGHGFYEWSPSAGAEQTIRLQRQLMQIQNGLQPSPKGDS